jgi:tetratricopeptide (TPR) repeat protein
MKKAFLVLLFGVIGIMSSAQEITKEREAEALSYLEKGNAKSDNGDWKGAIEDYDKAVKFNPKNAEGYYKRALMAHNLKDYWVAINDYSNAIRLNNAYADAFFGRGLCYFEVGKKDHCCIDLSKASGLGNTEAANTLANLCN